MDVNDKCKDHAILGLIDDKKIMPILSWDYVYDELTNWYVTDSSLQMEYLQGKLPVYMQLCVNALIYVIGVIDRWASVCIILWDVALLDIQRKVKQIMVLDRECGLSVFDILRNHPFL